MQETLYIIVKNFYTLVTKDVLIGYHFDKFNDPEVLEHHLVRLTAFWEMQLTGKATQGLDRPFQLMYTHLLLNIKSGELGRWVMLFHKTLDECEKNKIHPEMTLISTELKKRIEFFSERFKSHPQMFKNPY